MSLEEISKKMRAVRENADKIHLQAKLKATKANLDITTVTLEKIREKFISIKIRAEEKSYAWNLAEEVLKEINSLDTMCDERRRG
jgi:hypothetical protein